MKRRIECNAGAVFFVETSTGTEFITVDDIAENDCTAAAVAGNALKIFEWDFWGDDSFCTCQTKNDDNGFQKIRGWLRLALPQMSNKNVGALARAVLDTIRPKTNGVIPQGVTVTDIGTTE